MSQTDQTTTDHADTTTEPKKPWSEPTASMIDVPGNTFGDPDPNDEGPANSTSA